MQFCSSTHACVVKGDGLPAPLWPRPGWKDDVVQEGVVYYDEMMILESKIINMGQLMSLFKKELTMLFMRFVLTTIIKVGV